ncbi:unnamed protein product [Rotaria magnacalcarata]|uniref:Major facilitator superfamily (MFS) profile domain-containing protein n=6 Tax=Rotaria magnacalcarata TaxID=392030 RepID=A0A816U6H7_9BILA|nr:unnamed protein product [Rotaria magnacalcarata]CAF3907577.1 unnamed protein product [Rotaria magnacalcarata]
MTANTRYRRAFSLDSLPSDARYLHHHRSSLSETAWENEPIIATISPSTLAMNKILANSKAPKRIWDSDKALGSTHQGLLSKYQIRAYIFLALGYAVIGAWLMEMPAFALLPPKYIDCTPFYPNKSNTILQTSTQLNQIISNENATSLVKDEKREKIKRIYNYSKEYGRSALTDFDTLCDKTRVKLPYIVNIVGFILGALVLGSIADHSGRKMILLGSMWTACILSIFQLLSEEYISYVFFMFFLGVLMGAVHVIAIPVVMEMFPIKTRAIYSLVLLGLVFLLDLILPWLALGIKNWKILQAVISVPLVLTALLNWFMEESMFWHTAQKDYVSAILSLTKIAQYNSIVFQDVFLEAREFLRSKRSKGTQCDFQPLLRLEDIKTLGTKYPYFDIADLQTASEKNVTISKRILHALSGQHYYSTLSKFYPTDFIHSPIFTVYLVILCGLWLVSSLTEYSFDAPHITQHLTDSFHANYFYSHLIQIISFVIAFPLVYIWGRRWPTFCFFLIAEISLLGSVALKLDNEQTRVGTLIAYFVGKFATRAAYIVLVIYTSEIAPTGLRCTVLGICYTFRLIGIALASPDVGELNDWMPRLIYGVLSLILGAMALLLPETKTIPLPRTMLQIENIPTSISKGFRLRRRRSELMQHSDRPDEPRSRRQSNFNDTASMLHGIRSARPFDNQSTMHSIFELQDYGQYDTINSVINRYYHRMDLPSPSFHQPHAAINNETFRFPASIAEDVEYTDDVDNDQAGVALHHRLSDKKRLATSNGNILPTADIIVSSVVQERTSPGKQFSTDIGSQNQTEDMTTDLAEPTETIDDKKENNSRDYKLSPSPKYQRTMSQDENYFSEHC